MADLPKPAFIVTVTGRLVETEPTALTFDLPDGRHELCTAAQLEAYAAAKVAEERERCARLCEGRTKYATPDEYDQAALDCAAVIRGTEAASRGE